jgi:SAM-dependent methyltransferase
VGELSCDRFALPQSGVVNTNESKRHVMTEELMRLNRELAARDGVESAVHEKDFIYWFLVEAPHPTSAQPDVDKYFSDGAHSANQLAELVGKLDLPKDRKVRLLEFASGYGRVSRYFKKDPTFDLVCCDIHPEAIEFLTREIGVKALQSVSAPERFSTPNPFDAVFALSFFSHMPKSTFGPWLRALFKTLDAPGYLIFTTHGWASAKTSDLETLPPDGFLFDSTTEQKDIDSSEYGAAVVTPEFVFNEIRRQTGSQNISFQQAGWWGLQDLWVVKRDAVDLPPTPPTSDRQFELRMLAYFEKRVETLRKSGGIPWSLRPQAWLERATRNALRKSLSE